MNSLSNYFIEGLQGAGKSTMVNRLSKQLPEYKVFREGDYSPVELAWCAYVTESQYQDILTHYPSLENEIVTKTIAEGDHRIICYTQILTDVEGFHKDLEQYEIYNGNLDKDSFEKVILERYDKWDGQGQIFECSIFQNIIENQMLYLTMTDEEILDFYGRLKQILAKNGEAYTFENQQIPLTLYAIVTQLADRTVQYNELYCELHEAINKGKTL